MRRSCERGPQGQQSEVRGPQTAPSRIFDEAELLLQNLDGWKGMNSATMMQRGASTMSCGVEGRKTAIFEDSGNFLAVVVTISPRFVPSPCTPLWALSLHGTITKNCAPMSHVVMGDSCSKSDLRGFLQIVATP